MADEQTPEQIEHKRMIDRFEELGPAQVRAFAAVDGFPHHWRLGAMEWLREREKADGGPQGR